MTVCIGLVCGSGKYILLGADTRGSYGSVTSNDYMAKLFDLPAHYYGAIAGTGSYCEDIISELHHRMKQIQEVEIAPEQARKCILDSFFQVYTELAEEALLNGPRITMEQCLHDRKLVPNIRKQSKDILRSIPVKGSVILAGFYRGAPVQLIASPDYDDPSALSVVNEINPGNAVIGSGSVAALNWLNYQTEYSLRLGSFPAALNRSKTVL